MGVYKRIGLFLPFFFLGWKSLGGKEGAYLCILYILPGWIQPWLPHHVFFLGVGVGVVGVYGWLLFLFFLVLVVLASGRRDGMHNRQMPRVFLFGCLFFSWEMGGGKADNVMLVGCSWWWRIDTDGLARNDDDMCVYIV